MYPNHKNGDIDREDAEHEDEDGMSVVVEIIMDPRTLFQKSESCMSVCAHAHAPEKCLPLFLEPTSTPACRLLVVQCKRLSRQTDMELK